MLQGSTQLFEEGSVDESKTIEAKGVRMNPTKWDMMRTEVEYLLQNVLARPSFSAWNSPRQLDIKGRVSGSAQTSVR